MSTTQQHIDDGGTAFPHTTVNKMGGLVLQPGMSLRDWLAGMAMQGLLSKDYYSFTSDLDNAVIQAYKVADAIIAYKKGGSHE